MVNYFLNSGDASDSLTGTFFGYGLSMFIGISLILLRSLRAWKYDSCDYLISGFSYNGGSLQTILFSRVDPTHISFVFIEILRVIEILFWLFDFLSVLSDPKWKLTLRFLNVKVESDNLSDGRLMFL